MNHFHKPWEAGAKAAAAAGSGFDAARALRLEAPGLSDSRSALGGSYLKGAGDVVSGYK